PGGRQVATLGPISSELVQNLDGERTWLDGLTLVIGASSSANLNCLRRALPWLSPSIVGPRTSAGLGDRIGLATPGHIQALRQLRGNVAPVFAQQSIREMERTGRSPQQVIDEATWGVLVEGWRDGFGADGDHLKTLSDIDSCVDAGYTWYTL